MLFSIKNRPLPTLLLAAVLTLLALSGQRWFDLNWQLALRPEDAVYLALGLGALLVSDGVLHALFGLLFGDRYWRSYRALVNHFRPQGIPHILTGGLLAGAEELFFRGLILQGLVQQVGWGSLTAVLITGLLFGFMHLIWQPMLRPFALWAVWEGVLLGLVYLATGSLLVVVLAHALHDIAGFSLFAWQRAGEDNESIFTS